MNVRRRVGDALSVLTAINYVKKTTHGYVWIRNDTSCSEDLDSRCDSELWCAEIKKEVDCLRLKLEEKKAKLQSLIAMVPTLTWHHVQSRRIEKDKGQQELSVPLNEKYDVLCDLEGNHEESETSYNSISLPEFSYSDMPIELNEQELALSVSNPSQYR